ncbi:MAG: hypothetical protein ACHQ52_00905 [Candidatus Eisenbacteria bacterium]
MRRRRTARWIAIAAFLLFAATGGGRIVGSDEVSMLELGRSMLHGRIDIPPGATLEGRDGRAYTKNAAGQAVLALPLVAAGETLTRAAHLTPARQVLALRFVVSFFNALLTALLLAAFYLAARRYGIGAGEALAATAMLGFTTPVWVYAKSFMAEPMEALGLLLALAGACFADESDWRWRGAIGVLLAVSAKLTMLPFTLIALMPLAIRGWRERAPFVIALATAIAGHAVYDLARFGTLFETGYGRQATPSAYTTPLWVGLYGLLVSSGKGVLWFAPALLLAPVGWRRAHRTHHEPKPMPAVARRVADRVRGWLPEWLRPTLAQEVPEKKWDDLRRAAPAIALIWAGALLLYGTFEHWAGDGSFGPRYLIPFLPPAFLLVAAALPHPSQARRRTIQVLTLAGLLVQIGGVAIHFGAQMREAGDYPYTRALDDPRFMSDSHFNPAFSPILGHWRMLVRNTGEHLRGTMPRLVSVGATPADTALAATPAPSVGVAPTPGAPVEQRVGVSAEDQTRLLHALDFWWLYAAYAGMPAVALGAAAALLAAFGVAAALRARSASRRED